MTIAKARALRKNATDAEMMLWQSLRNNQLAGCKFRRQHEIGKYAADFVCIEKKLIIEVDGGQHSQEKYKDGVRDGWLREQGFKVLRIWDNEVLTNIVGVLDLVRESATPSPHPSRQGRGSH